MHEKTLATWTLTPERAVGLTYDLNRWAIGICRRANYDRGHLRVSTVEFYLGPFLLEWVFLPFPPRSRRLMVAPVVRRFG